MDYRELLKKYIAHIIDNEGIDYTDEYKFDNPGCTVAFSDQEKTELAILAEEVRQEFNS